MSSRSLYLVRFLTFCWVTGGHTIHPPIERLTTNWYWAHIALKLPPAVAYYYTQCLMNPIQVNILVFQVSSRNTRKCVKCIKSQASFWCLYCQLWTYFATFFFLPRFFSQTFTNHRTAGEGERHFFNSSLPLPPSSQTLSQVIAGESSPLYPQLAAGLEPGTFGFRRQVANHYFTSF